MKMVSMYFDPVSNLLVNQIYNLIFEMNNSYISHVLQNCNYNINISQLIFTPF